MPRKRKHPPLKVGSNPDLPKSNDDQNHVNIQVDDTCMPCSVNTQSTLHQINHPVSFIPIFEYESVFRKIPMNSDNASKTDENVMEDMNSRDIGLRQEAIRNLESDPSLIHIFHERNEGLKSSKTMDMGSTTNNNSTSCSKVTPKWVLVKRHPFYHAAFYQTIMDSSDKPSIQPTSSTDNTTSNENIETQEERSSSSPPSTAIQVRLKEGAFPVYSQCTCMTLTNLYSAVSPSAFEYIAIGDSSGYVTVYTMAPFITSINRFETSASKRESLEDQDLLQIRQDRRKRGVKRTGVAKDEAGENVYVRTLDNKASISSQCQNAIEALCFTASASHIIVGTKEEIESIHCHTGMIEWKMLLSTIPGGFLSGECHTPTKYLTRNSITRLDAHPWLDDGGIVASFTFGSSLDDEDPSSQSDKSQTSPCLLLQSSKWGGSTNEGSLCTMNNSCNHSGIIPKNDIPKENPLYIGPHGLAIWDRSMNNRILASFLTVEGTLDPSKTLESINFKHELFLLEHNSQSIVHRIELPTKSGGSKYTLNVAINQSENGTYSIITAAKIGIRLFLTEGLQPLSVYGEGISLHGFSINWQDCFFMQWGKNADIELLTKLVKQWRRGSSREREDEVLYRSVCEQAAHRAKEQRHQDSFSNLFIVGIPNAFKEPLEVNDTIHFWDLSGIDFIGGQKLPSFTLKVPGKNASINSLKYSPGRLDGENGKLLLISHSGDLHHLSPSIASDWAGAMYSPGYQLVDDNIIVIEDEDAVDNVIDTGNNCEFTCGRHDASPHNAVSGARVDYNQTFLSDLELALKLSVVDQRHDTDDQDIIFDVLGHDEKSCIQAALLCHPEPFLQGSISSTTHQSTSAMRTSTDDGMSGIFQLLPNMGDALCYLENEKAKTSKRIVTIAHPNDKGMQMNSCSSKKRNKSNEILADMMNPSLRESLLGRESSASGSGSFPSSTTESTSDGGTLFCIACRGRMVRHTCGKRILPVDHAALEVIITTTKRTGKVIRPRSKSKKASVHIKSEDIMGLEGTVESVEMVRSGDMNMEKTALPSDFDIHRSSAENST